MNPDSGTRRPLFGEIRREKSYNHGLADNSFRYFALYGGSLKIADNEFRYFVWIVPTLIEVLL